MRTGKTLTYQSTNQPTDMASCSEFNPLESCGLVYVIQRMKRLGGQMSPDIKQIDIDVLRTFRDNIMYKDRYGIK